MAAFVFDDSTFIYNFLLSCETGYVYASLLVGAIFTLNIFVVSVVKLEYVFDVTMYPVALSITLKLVGFNLNVRFNFNDFVVS